MKNNSELSKGRKIWFNVGTVLFAIGFILFLLPFMSFASIFFNLPIDFVVLSFPLAFVGFIFVGIGQAIRHYAKLGVAGGGLILDPDQAREDLKPYSQMAGGMLKDALEVTDLQSKEIVKVRCPHCKELNDEDARFCKSCGQNL